VNVSVATLAGMAVDDGNNVGVGDAITTRAVGAGDGDDVDVGDGGDIGFEAVATDVVTMTTGRVLGTDLDFVFANVTGLVSFTASPSAIKKPRTVNIIIATSARLARIAFCLFVMLCCQLSLSAAIASCAINPTSWADLQQCFVESNIQTSIPRNPRIAQNLGLSNCGSLVRMIVETAPVSKASLCKSRRASAATRPV
jgi:hypothetical protein